jgi:cytochrome P450
MNQMIRPERAPLQSPLDAVTHPDPYGYYAQLVEERPFYFEPACGFWIATSAAAARQVLLEPACRVRPLDEPVPKCIAGSGAGDLFGSLVRMRDGAAHGRLKQLIAEVLGGCDLQHVGDLAAAAARNIVSRQACAPLHALMYELPVHVIAMLCGLSDGPSRDAGRLIGPLVESFAGRANAQQLAESSHVADRLRELFSTTNGAGLVGDMARSPARTGLGDAPIVANGVGFLSQTYEATAGLIGNTLLALSRHPEARAAGRGNLERVVREVLRHDSPVQNTRRYAARELTILGIAVPQGAAILVVLAAASRDPAANPRPHCFDTDRANPTVFGFSAGPHRCPGEVLAVTIATAAVSTLLQAGFDPMTIAGQVPYRPSANIRIPLFAEI